MPITPNHPNPFGNGYNPVRDDRPMQASGGVSDLANTTGTIHTGVVNHDAAAGTYNLSAAGANVLSVYFSQNNGGLYGKVTKTLVAGVDVVDLAAASAAEIASAFNGNGTFAKFFVAANAAGTLRITARFPSSRFKTYFGGGGAAALGGVWTTAIAPGSAVASANVAGKDLEFVVQDQSGNALGGIDVYVSVLNAVPTGTPVATAAIGEVTKGGLVSNNGGNDGVRITSDGEGKVAFRVAESVGAADQVVVRVYSNTSRLAINNQGKCQVTFA